MISKYSELRYAIEIIFIHKYNKLRWWEFGKKKKLRKWRDDKLNFHNLK